MGTLVLQSTMTTLVRERRLSGHCSTTRQLGLPVPHVRRPPCSWHFLLLMPLLKLALDGGWFELHNNNGCRIRFAASVNQTTTRVSEYGSALTICRGSILSARILSRRLALPIWYRARGSCGITARCDAAVALSGNGGHCMPVPGIHACNGGGLRGGLRGCRHKRRRRCFPIYHGLQRRGAPFHGPGHQRLCRSIVYRHVYADCVLSALKWDPPPLLPPPPKTSWIHPLFQT